MRKLILAKETLAELTTSELTSVVGASALPCLQDIVRQVTTGDSDFAQCHTGGC